MASVDNILAEDMKEVEANTMYSTTSTGILMPVLCHRQHWRIIFESFVVKDEVNILSAQAVRCNFDYKNKTLDVVIEQSITGEEHILIGSLTEKHNFTVRVDMLNGNDGIYHSVACLFCAVDSHSFALDYAKGDTAIHQLKIKYKNLTVLELKK